MKLIQVMTKARKFHGAEFPSEATKYAMAFNDDKSITIYCNRVPCTTFRVGDAAEYNSYNLRYVGEITKITEKAITIVAYKGSKGMETTHRLGLNEFCWRNDTFDEAKVAAENADTMQYI